MSTAEDQQPPNVPRVGFLTTLDSSSPTFAAFRQGLSELGYVENENIVIEIGVTIPANILERADRIISDNQ